jgi:D-aspartate ligase
MLLTLKSLLPGVKAASKKCPTPVRRRASASGPGALVIGGDCGALGVARSLGRAGIPVFFLAGKNPLAAYSRYTTQHCTWPGADDSDAVAWLIDLATRHALAGWTLFPNADEEVRLIAQHHDTLRSTFRLCTPAWETTKWLADKSLIYEKAANAQIPYPKTYQLSGSSDLAALDFKFPLILKPAIKEGQNALTQSKVWRAADREMLTRLFDDAAVMAGPGGLIVQELIPGDGDTQFSYAAVCHDGRPVLSMVAQRIRQHPANYGTGTYVETVENEVVERQAERLLQSVGYSGMVEMEFKFDIRDGAYKLLDVNPRAWTWNSIGTVAGVDFPLTMWRLAQGETPPRMRARPGAGWMYFSRDFPEAFREIFEGKLSCGAYLRSFSRPLGFAAFALDDPLPSLADWPVTIKRWLAR